MLALFVESKTSGCEEIETPEQHAHYYGYHIATLKVSFVLQLISIHVRILIGSEDEYKNVHCYMILRGRNL